MAAINDVAWETVAMLKSQYHRQERRWAEVLEAREQALRALKERQATLESEVSSLRQRTRADFGGALASVAAAKRRKLVRAARFLLHIRPTWRRSIVRFDVVGVQGNPCGLHEIAWIKDAFRAG